MLPDPRLNFPPTPPQSISTSGNGDVDNRMEDGDDDEIIIPQEEDFFFAPPAQPPMVDNPELETTNRSVGVSFRCSGYAVVDRKCGGNEIASQKVEEFHPLGYVRSSSFVESFLKFKEKSECDEPVDPPMEVDRKIHM